MEPLLAQNYIDNFETGSTINYETVDITEDKMESVQLLKNLVFQDKGPMAQPLHVDPNGRAILFMLKPGQSIREHNVPSSPFYVVILRGRGVFTGRDGVEQTFGPDTLPLPFRFLDPGDMLPLGRNAAVAQLGKRILVLFNGCLEYLFYERAVRLIIPYPERGLKGLCHTGP